MITRDESGLLKSVGNKRFGTILIDPPWRFLNKTGKIAPEHKRLARYQTMSFDEIKALPVRQVTAPVCHLYLWTPNALLPEAISVMLHWGFQYKSNIVWHKIRKDGGSDGRGVGFYFRNVTELILFGVMGKNARTLAPGRSQVNYICSRKREHSRKPDDPFYDRDLTTFRLLFDLNVLSAGVIITRSSELQDIFDELGRGKSFGNSTTHWGKLTPKLNNRASGGCPVLAFGIKKMAYDPEG